MGWLMELTYIVTVLVEGEEGKEPSPDAQRDFADQFLADRMMIGDERPVAENSYSGLRLWGVKAELVDTSPAPAVG